MAEYADVVITVGADSITLTTPYEAVDLCRRIPGRWWHKDTKQWSAPLSAEDAIRKIFAEWPGTVHWQGVSSSNGSVKRPTSWADGLFAQTPATLHKPVYKALSKVLHPDTGGDTAAMQQLNDAYARTNDSR